MRSRGDCRADALHVGGTGLVDDGGAAACGSGDCLASALLVGGIGLVDDGAAAMAAVVTFVLVLSLLGASARLTMGGLLRGLRWRLLC